MYQLPWLRAFPSVYREPRVTRRFIKIECIMTRCIASDRGLSHYRRSTRGSRRYILNGFIHSFTSHRPHALLHHFPAVRVSICVHGKYDPEMMVVPVMTLAKRENFMCYAYIAAAQTTREIMQLKEISGDARVDTYIYTHTRLEISSLTSRREYSPITLRASELADS